jgi:hypothetical protein
MNGSTWDEQEESRVERMGDLNSSVSKDALFAALQLPLILSRYRTFVTLLPASGRLLREEGREVTDRNPHGGGDSNGRKDPAAEFQGESIG